jgi:hypothetical protein
MPCPPTDVFPIRHSPFPIRNRVSFYAEGFVFLKIKIVLSASVGAFCFVRKDTCAVRAGSRRVYSARFQT